MPSGPNADAHVKTIVFLLFGFAIALLAGGYLINRSGFSFGGLQHTIAARESQAVLEDITDLDQIDEALRRHPSNRLLQIVAKATSVEARTGAAIEQLSMTTEPPLIWNKIDVASASRSDLEALRRDLKAAEGKVGIAQPRFIDLMKSGRSDVETYAAAHADRDAVSKLLEAVDKRHAKITANFLMLLSARSDFYRAYEKCIAVLVGEYGSFRVVNGQFVFPFEESVVRYNNAASEMTAAAKRVAEQEEERRQLMRPQLESWLPFVGRRVN